MGLTVPARNAARRCRDSVEAAGVAPEVTSRSIADVTSWADESNQDIVIILAGDRALNHTCMQLRLSMTTGTPAKTRGDVGEKIAVAKMA